MAFVDVLVRLSVEGQETLRFHYEYLNLCFGDERKSYRFVFQSFYLLF